jgi:hypothetical protein
VITNVPSQVENVSVLTSAESGLITDHSTIVFNLKTSVKAAAKLKRRVFDYKRGNFDGLRAALEALDLYSAIESEVNVQEERMKWKELFLKATHENIPTKTIKNINSPPWINAEIIHATQKRKLRDENLNHFRLML